ncbi:MAG: sortase [Candidatus Saccharibacteria bacterium]|nr:sortase [Candidatus Saccharibacteria bacterium]
MLKNHLKLKIAGVLLAILAISLGVFFGIKVNQTSASSNLLLIPSIGLETSPKQVALDDHNLIAPATEAGVYHSAKNKDLLIGHSTTIFKNLHQVKLHDKITYGDVTYTVIEMYADAKEDISMDALLKTENTPTLILMTCAGESLDEGDFSHRLIIRAIAQ